MFSLGKPKLRRSFELVVAVDGHSQGCAHLLQAPVTQPAETLCEGSNRNALHRVEIDSRLEWDRIVTGLQAHLTCQPSNRLRHICRGRADGGTEMHPSRSRGSRRWPRWSRSPRRRRRRRESEGRGLLRRDGRRGSLVGRDSANLGCCSEVPPGPILRGRAHCGVSGDDTSRFQRTGEPGSTSVPKT